MSTDGHLPNHRDADDGFVMPGSLFVMPTSPAAATTVHPSGGASSQHLASQHLASQLAAIVELLSQLDAADRLEQAARIAARGVAQWLSADRVVMTMCLHDDRDHQIIADSSGTDSDDPGLITAATEISLRGTLTDSHSRDHLQRHSMMAVRQWAKKIGARRILGVSFEGSLLAGGALVVIHNRTLAQNRADSQLAALDTLRLPLANKLAAIRRNERGALAEFFHRIARPDHRRKQKWILVALLLLGGLLSVPMHYRIAADCQLQPAKRRYIAAPLDGPLEKANVRPGDTVAAGDLLATINPREIDFQLAAKQAERERLLAVYKGQMSQRKFAESKLTDLERQQVELELALLLHHKEHLEIRSPIEGIVIGDDLARREGIPLSQGETLMEIAPIDKMLVEISVPESDLHHVSAGMSATFQLFAVPGERLSAKVDRVHPAAELIDHDNVFVADAEVVDRVGVLRPGMRGRAWIQGHRKPLAWILLHKAYYAARQLFGWW